MPSVESAARSSSVGRRDDITVAHVKEAQAVGQVILDPREHGHAVSQWNDAGKREAQQRGGGIAGGEQVVAQRREADRIGNRPVPLEPLVTAGAQGRDHRHGTGRKVYQQALARLITAETVGLGRAGIPTPRIDAEQAVPVPQCEVIEVRAAHTVGRDQVRRFALSAEIADRAVRQADAQSGAGGFHAIESLGRIVAGVPVEQGRGQQPDAVRDLVRQGFCQHGDIGHAALAHAVPQAAVAGEVMVAGQQPPAAGIALHTGHRLDDGTLVRAFGIEHVPGDENVPGLVLRRRPADGIDRIETRFGERGAGRRVETAERLAELPVGGVNEAHQLALERFSNGGEHAVTRKNAENKDSGAAGGEAPRQNGILPVERGRQEGWRSIRRAPPAEVRA